MSALLRSRSLQRCVAGIVIGRERVAVAHLRGNGSTGWTASSLAERTLGTLLFCAHTTPETESELAAALGALAGELRTRHAPAHVVLPDPVFRSAVLELEQLPKSRELQAQLVEFRLRRSVARPVELCCDSQPLGRIGERHVLLAMAIERSWRDLVSAALAHAGIVAWTVTSAATQPFNLFHDSLARESGALVSLAGDSWALWLWGRDGIVRHVRSHWRQTGDDLVLIAGEVSRAIVAYVDADPGNAIASLSVFGGSEAQELAAILDQRSSQPCTRLSAEAFLANADALPARSEAMSYALAAAMST